MMKRGVVLSEMILIATTHHAGQFDRGGNPYILHPLTVMRLLHNNVRDEELMQAAAVGHDVLEDTKCTKQEMVERGIPSEIIDAIMCVTKMPGQSYEEYQEAVKSNKIATFVKMADLTHNSDLTRLKGVSDKDIERHSKYIKFYYMLEQHAKQQGWL